MQKATIVREAETGSCTLQYAVGLTGCSVASHQQAACCDALSPIGQ